eukprot:Rhum_TRINITY_DN14618_c20_g1::Rhum_TRINITY_DN14618_c20_g1_i1::g.106026::m.106026
MVLVLVLLRSADPGTATRHERPPLRLHDVVAVRRRGGRRHLLQAAQDQRLLGTRLGADVQLNERHVPQGREQLPHTRAEATGTLRRRHAGAAVVAASAFATSCCSLFFLLLFFRNEACVELLQEHRPLRLRGRELVRLAFVVCEARRGCGRGCRRRLLGLGLRRVGSGGGGGGGRGGGGCCAEEKRVCKADHLLCDRCVLRLCQVQVAEDVAVEREGRRRRRRRLLARLVVAVRRVAPPAAAALVACGGDVVQRQRGVHGGRAPQQKEHLAEEAALAAEAAAAAAEACVHQVVQLHHRRVQVPEHAEHLLPLLRRLPRLPHRRTLHQVQQADHPRVVRSQQHGVECVEQHVEHRLVVVRGEGDRHTRREPRLVVHTTATTRRRRGLRRDAARRAVRRGGGCVEGLRRRG